MASPPQRRQQLSEPGRQTPDFNEITAALQQARVMLDWGDNWDGEGSAGYATETWQRASDFLTNCARELWERHQRVVPVPEIEPGPNGSIDFHWHAGDRELLLNVPADPNEMVDFYGDSSTGEVIKGRAHTSTVGPWLLAWLTR